MQTLGSPHLGEASALSRRGANRPMALRVTCLGDAGYLPRQVGLLAVDSKCSCLGLLVVPPRIVSTDGVRCVNAGRQNRKTGRRGANGDVSTLPNNNFCTFMVLHTHFAVYSLKQKRLTCVCKVYVRWCKMRLLRIIYV